LHDLTGQAPATFSKIHRLATEHDCRPLLARSHYHLALTYHYCRLTVPADEALRRPAR